MEANSDDTGSSSSQSVHVRLQEQVRSLELSIDVKDFLSAPHLEPIKAKDMEEAMASLTKATRSFLVKRHREFPISSLHLKLYFINTFLCEVGLLVGDTINIDQFKLSELIHGTTGIHTLTLDFKGENLWMQPEMKQLCTALNKLRKLFVRGIFVEFDILWMMAFLAAAPSIEMLHIEVWEHVCDMDEVSEDFRQRTNFERRSPQWEMDFDNTNNWVLEELVFIGFRSLEQQFTFIRSVLQRSPNLRKIVLKGYEECIFCATPGVPPSKFPKKDEQEMVMRRTRDGLFSPQIIFDEYSGRRRRM
uniref:FBD domain-containing protein n=1 Tax=Aegilops tauschii TaxID=37682 RepID=M8B5F6_AEGTA